MAVSAVDTTTAANTVNAGIGSLANNYETFLKLLTTQLKNQDPLSPLDTNNFTQQLTQMTGVQQQLLTNQLLTQMISQGQVGLSGSAVNLIGKSVTAEKPTMTLTIEPVPVPLRTDESGSVRVGESRVSLDVVIREFMNGADPESIVQNSWPA